MGAPTPKPVKERTLSISSDFGPLRFSYPDSGNMDEHVRATISGATYPWPGMPPGYAYDTIVDIGANIGASALWFMSCKPKRLVCFEPSRESLALLRRNVGALPGVEIRQAVLVQVAVFQGGLPRVVDAHARPPAAVNPAPAQHRHRKSGEGAPADHGTAPAAQ